MRLIDADLLLEEMSAGCIPIMEKGISGITGDNECIKDYIDNAPTTFDVDNVVEQLEDAMGFYKGFVDSANSEYEADRWTHKAETYGEAIEIVKAGGKNE